MLLLHVSTCTVVRQIQANVRVVWIFWKRAWRHGPPVRRRVKNAQKSPTVEILAAVSSSPASDDREPCHFAAFCVIHPIHRDSIIVGTNEEHLRNRSCPTGPFGTCPGVHAPAEALGFGQGRQLPIQWIGRGALLQGRATGHERSRPAVPRRRRSVGVRSLRESTSSIRRPLRRSTISTVQPEPRST